jgi:hypothetical protein
MIDDAAVAIGTGAMCRTITFLQMAGRRHAIQTFSANADRYLSPTQPDFDTLSYKERR